MSDRRLDEEGQEPDPEEFEVKIEEAEDLDAAMREALEAVERRDDDSPDAGVGEAGIEAAGAAATTPSELERQVAELKERHVRTLADFENFRKRVERERALDRRYEGLEVLAELLPLLDNLQLALDAEGDVEDLKTGVELIVKQFRDLLRRHGVERIRAAGEPFDPSVHHAVSRDEDPEVEVATVADELRAGYRMGERLLRPASVRVSVPPEPERASRPAAAPDPESLN